MILNDKIEVDNIFRALGIIGKYQWKQILWHLMGCVSWPIHMVSIVFIGRYKLSRPMGLPTICIGENKGEADQRLCYRNTDKTIPLLSKSKSSSL